MMQLDIHHHSTWIDQYQNLSRSVTHPSSVLATVRYPHINSSTPMIFNVPMANIRVSRLTIQLAGSEADLTDRGTFIHLQVEWSS